MDSALHILVLHGLPAGSMLGLLFKGALICLTGVAVCAELSAMPAVVRHRIAFGTVICLALLPLLSWSITPWSLEVLPRDANRSPADLWGIAAWLAPIYLAVATFLLGRLCLDIVRTALLSNRAAAAGSAAEFLPGIKHPRKNTQVRISQDIRTPVTWGWLRPRVLLPATVVDWPEDDIAMVLQHELTHIERADWIAHLLARCVHALYWPLPGINNLMNQQSLSAEQACDDRVLAAGAAAPAYAAMLLRQARGTRVPATMALGQESELGIRVRYMVTEIVDHSVFANGSATTFVACLAVTLPLATVELARRPELPVLEWGSVSPGNERPPLPGPRPTMQANVSASHALRPGPERPAKPPSAKKPPRHNHQDKPTIPPP